MSVYEKLINKETSLVVVGLGYVGLPLAIEFSKKADVIGFDVNTRKIERYKKCIDSTNEVGNEALRQTKMQFTSDENKLIGALFYIVAVPTPINDDKTPDLRPVIGASEVVGRNIHKGSIVVYESTVYPGVTEEICVPIIERLSGLKCGVDFKVGYSPERINPGDQVHRVTNIVKIVSGMDEESLNDIADTYRLIIEGGVYKVESIKVAEAAKVIENSQRDINIAFMNELSIIFNKMDIDTKSVLKAAKTKWNFLDFKPGLVGGHCIGVDPYYLTYKAEQLGYQPQVILSGRRINDNMGKYIAENVVKQLIKADKQIKGAKVLIMGFTFKENVPDTRNTRVIDIVNELKEYEIEVVISDPVADADEAKHEYGINMTDYSLVKDIDAVVIAVAHDGYKGITLAELKQKFCYGIPVIVDVKLLYERAEATALGFRYWSL